MSLFFTTIPALVVAVLVIILVVAVEYYSRPPVETRDTHFGLRIKSHVAYSCGKCVDNMNVYLLRAAHVEVVGKVYRFKILQLAEDRARKTIEFEQRQASVSGEDSTH